MRIHATVKRGSEAVQSLGTSQTRCGRASGEETPARARECPRVPAVFDLGNAKWGSAGRFSKPSDGLEPSTPSLPWRFWRGIGEHAWSFAVTFPLQIILLRLASCARVYPRVPRLMYPSRTRELLSVCTTSTRS
jgi:hypothetical protein